MAENRKGVGRVDLPEIYAQCERETAYKQQVLDGNFDDLVITENERPLMHQYCLEGTARISNQVGYVKTSNQSGIDALSYDSVEDIDTNNSGETFSEGEKLVYKEMQDIVFDITGVENDQNMYTVVQQLIKSALIAYVLYKWYELKGLQQDSVNKYMQYEQYLPEIRFNCVQNHSRRPSRPYKPMGL
jgi:hypothetical protein